jgi:hypothetical protein
MDATALPYPYRVSPLLEQNDASGSKFPDDGLRPKDVTRHPDNIFLLWDGVPARHNILQQIKANLRSIRRHAPDARVYLFSNVLAIRDLAPFTNCQLVRWTYETLGENTPLAGQVPSAGNDWCAWSDVFRLLCLWRWGGTYFDVDDLMIASPPAGHNVIAACFLDHNSGLNWPSSATIPSCFVRSTGVLPRKNGPAFRIGADPLTNFSSKNKFVERWLSQIPETPMTNWGQILPSEIFAAAPEWASKHVATIPWCDLLYHPYDWGHHQQDQRYPGERIYSSQLITRERFLEKWQTLRSTYDFYLIKNHCFECQAADGPIRKLLAWAVQEAWGEQREFHAFSGDLA